MSKGQRISTLPIYRLLPERVREEMRVGATYSWFLVVDFRNLFILKPRIMEKLKRWNRQKALIVIDVEIVHTEQKAAKEE